MYSGIHETLILSTGDPPWCEHDDGIPAPSSSAGSKVGRMGHTWQYILPSSLSSPPPPRVPEAAVLICLDWGSFFECGHLVEGATAARFCYPDFWENLSGLRL